MSGWITMTGSIVFGRHAAVIAGKTDANVGTVRSFCDGEICVRAGERVKVAGEMIFQRHLQVRPFSACTPLSSL